MFLSNKYLELNFKVNLRNIVYMKKSKSKDPTEKKKNLKIYRILDIHIKDLYSHYITYLCSFAFIGFI